MNRINLMIFQLIKEKAEHLREQTDNALEKYQREMNQAREKATVYKNEGQFIQAQKDILSGIARSEIVKAQRAFGADIERYCETLQDQLSEHVSEPINGAFRDQLGTIAQFGIKPSETQIRALLKQNGGNSLGIQALSKVLTDVGSRYKITSRAMEEYEADLRTIRQLAVQPISYNIMTYHHEAIEVLGGVPVVQTRDDGSTYTTAQSFDNDSLLAATALFNIGLDKVNGMAKSWAADLSITTKDVSADDEEEPESTTVVGDSDRDPIELAKKLGRDKARAAETYSELKTMTEML